MAFNVLRRTEKTRVTFRNHKPSLENQFKKPKRSGRKASDQTCKRKPKPETLIGRLEDREKKAEKKVWIDDLHAKRIVSYELFFRSLVPRLVERCQGNSGVKLKTTDDGDYLLIKSHGLSTYTVKEETKTKYGPQYVHFNSECLLEYAHAKHDIKYNQVSFANSRVDRLMYDPLAEEEKTTLISYGLNSA